MKILIAPDSFKESLSAIEVANAIEAGFKQIFPEATYYKLPMADGGEGTMQAIVDAKEGHLISCDVKDPLGRTISAQYGWVSSEKLAVIEMAESSGLMRLLPKERNPLITSTFGTGQLIKCALDQGAKRIILAIGGSATNDGGAGMLCALGATFLDAKGRSLPAGGLALQDLASIDLSYFDFRLADTIIEVACDVNNPLIGDHGASHIFGSQKGASASEVLVLDKALGHYADITQELIGHDYRDIAGSGAAGGMGFAALSFLKGTLRPGIEIVLETVNFAEFVQNVDLVITGEGKIDAQTIHGKTPIGVAKQAKIYHKPVIALAGSLGVGAEMVYQYGIDLLFSIMQKPDSLENALQEAAVNLEKTSRSIAALYQLGLKGNIGTVS